MGEAILVKIMVLKSISIVGAGYVGLCTGVGFATRGFKVILSEKEAEKVAYINKGKPSFYESSLEKLLKDTVSKGHLKGVIGCEEAVLNTDVTFIAVGTPNRLDGSIDLTYIKSASEEIGEVLADKEEYHVVVVKSTVAPCTTQNTVKPLLEKHSNKRCGVDFGLCMNPEFLREGSAIYDTLHPDRIVIGEYDKRSGNILEDLYRRFHRKEIPPILRTNLTNAELIKYANNAFLATKISFINTIANICEKTPEADVTIIAKGIGLDRRISPHFLRAGLGYGGSCFPKDVKALIAYSKEIGYEPQLIESVEEVNQLQPLKVVETLKGLIGEIKHKRIAILGLAFKPDTDDMREAVSIKIINKLLKEEAEISAYDPAATDNAKKIFGEKITYASSMEKCLHKADCCIVVTEWDKFKTLRPEDLKNMRTRALIDGRRITDPEKFKDGIKYAAIGLGSKKPTK